MQKKKKKPATTVNIPPVLEYSLINKLSDFLQSTCRIEGNLILKVNIIYNVLAGEQGMRPIFSDHQLA